MRMRCRGRTNVAVAICRSNDSLPSGAATFRVGRCQLRSGGGGAAGIPGRSGVVVGAQTHEHDRSQRRSQREPEDRIGLPGAGNPGGEKALGCAAVTTGSEYRRPRRRDHFDGEPGSSTAGPHPVAMPTRSIASRVPTRITNALRDAAAIAWVSVGARARARRGLHGCSGTLWWCRS
jgi:hypothetical protein